jgi:hypothetical protein
VLPTAKQFVAVAQATPFRSGKCAPTGFGLGTTVHDDPFHRSMSVLKVPPVTELPTAKHSDALAHVTPANLDCVAPAALGLGISDHALPFHCSTRVELPGPFAENPTAKQFIAVTQLTPVNTPIAGPGGFALGVTFHAGVAAALDAIATRPAQASVSAATTRAAPSARPCPACIGTFCTASAALPDHGFRACSWG